MAVSKKAKEMHSLPHHSWIATGNDMFRCAKCGLVKHHIKSMNKSVFYKYSTEVENTGCIKTTK
jgi:hypothetical protein